MKKFITITICLFSVCILQAQIPENPTSALSPNAANLGLYGDCPVSLYTGTPQISIPLYELNVSGFTLPITLNYHASGVRVDEHPSWVGLGWSLFAGGVITRKVNGIADEYQCSDCVLGNAASKDAGYYFLKPHYPQFFNATDWNTTEFLQRTLDGGDLSILRNYDTEPDEFSFNFLGHSGKFYLDHNKNWVVQSNSPLKVERLGFYTLPPPLSTTPNTLANTHTYNNVAGVYKCFSGFSITDETGTKYIFGQNTNAIEFSTDFFLQVADVWTANSWYLTQIILPNQESIYFTYKREEFVNQMYISVQQSSYSGSSSFPVFITGGLTFYSHNCYGGGGSTLIDRSYSGKLISPVYLTRIMHQNTTIEFNKKVSQELKYDESVYAYKKSLYGVSGAWEKLLPPYFYNLYKEYNIYLNNNFPFLPYLTTSQINCRDLECLDNLKWYKLNDIQIRNGSELIKTIDFNYSNNSNQRLTLGSVTEAGKPPYTFSYYNINNLPPYLANKSDHWGYYNDNYAQPIVDLNNTYHHLRNANAEYTKYGTLTKITYPTGGYTEFEFEAHSYRKQLQEQRWNTNYITEAANKIAGGVRIRKIKNYTSENNLATQKEYFYVSDYLQNGINANYSSGFLGGQHKYLFRANEVLNDYDPSTVGYLSGFFSNSVLSACQNTNSHIGYSEVIERLEDGSFIRYKFTNFDSGNAYMDKAPEATLPNFSSPYRAYNAKDMMRGNLVLQEDYNSNGNKIRSIDIVYEKNKPDNQDYVRSVKLNQGIICPNAYWFYSEGTSYKIYTYLMRPIRRTETLYNPVNQQPMQEQTEIIGYNDYNLISTITTTNSNNQTFTTLNKYPTDFGNFSTYNTMVSKNILSPVVQQITYLNGSNKVVSGEYRKFSEYTTSSGKIYKPQNVSYLLNDNNVTTTNYDSYWKQKMTFTYNNVGKILTAVDSESSFSTIYLWGYKSQYPIIKIENATLAQVKDLTDESYWIQADKTFNIKEFAVYRYNGQLFAHTELLKDMYLYQSKIDKVPENTPVDIAVRFDDFQEIKSADELAELLKKYSENLVYLPVDFGNFNTEDPENFSGGIHLLFKGLNATGNPVSVSSISYIDRSLFGYEIFSEGTAVVQEIPEDQIIQIGEALRLALSDAWVWTYTHKPLVGLISITDPHGVTTTFEYDEFGRLKNTKDNDLKLLQEYYYNYKQ